MKHSATSIPPNTFTHKHRFESTGKADKKKWVDKFTGKEINFKKYLEIKFFVNGVEVAKTTPLLAILYKHKPNFNIYQVLFPFLCGC